MGLSKERTLKFDEGRFLAQSTDAARVVNAAKFFECFDFNDTEVKALGIVPRESLTSKQGLRMFPQTMETETIVTKQRDKVTGSMIEVTNQRQTWKSDKTLLRRNRPHSNNGFYFKKSKSEPARYQVEEPAIKETPIPEEID